MSSQSSSQDPQPQSRWKSLVNKLLGPDTAAPLKPLTDPNDLDGLDLDLLPPEPAPPAPSTRPASPAKAAATKERILSDVTFDAEEEPLAAAAPEPSGDAAGEPAEVFFSDEADAVDEDLQSSPADAPPEERPGDSYWDALSGLQPGPDADEPREAARSGGRGSRGRPGDRRGSAGGGPRGGGRRESSRGDSRSRQTSRDEPASRTRSEAPAGDSRPRPDRTEGGTRSARPAPVNPDLFGDDDFGVGLTEESRAQIEAQESAAELEPREAEAETTERPRRRRGRRGRRGRGRERVEAGLPVDEAAAPAEADESDNDETGFDDEPPRKRSESRSAARDAAPVAFDEPAAADETDDGFGAGLGGGSARRGSAADDAPRERSRRGRRGRGGSSRTAPPLETSAGRDESELTAGAAADEEGETESADDRRDRYRNIPTWEEAISYLVRPKRRSRDSGRSGGRSSRGSRG